MKPFNLLSLIETGEKVKLIDHPFLSKLEKQGYFDLRKYVSSASTTEDILYNILEANREHLLGKEVKDNKYLLPQQVDMNCTVFSKMDKLAITEPKALEIRDIEENGDQSRLDILIITEKEFWNLLAFLRDSAEILEREQNISLVLEFYNIPLTREQMREAIEEDPEALEKALAWNRVSQVCGRVGEQRSIG